MFQDFHLQYVIANPALTRQIGMDIAWIFNLNFESKTLLKT